MNSGVNGCKKVKRRWWDGLLCYPENLETRE